MPEIKDNFEKSAETYEAAGGLQKEVAALLAGYLPPKIGNFPQKILEIGCGTGFLSEHLIQKYPHSEIWFTDIADAQLAQNRRIFDARVMHGRGLSDCYHWACMDGAQIDLDGPFDLIVSSMVLQWLDEPDAVLSHWQTKLSDNGEIYFATIGPDNFQEWRASCDALSLQNGVHFPSIMHKNLQMLGDFKIVKDYGDGRGFLKMLKATGAQGRKPGTRALTRKQMTDVLAYFDATYAGCVTWHVVLGRLSF